MGRQAAKEIYGVGVQSHGDGASDVQNHRDGQPRLDGKYLGLLCEQSARMRDIESLNKTVPITRSIVNCVLHAESKRFAARLHAEEASYKAARQEFREYMEHKKSMKRLQEKITEAQALLRHCKKEKRRVEAVVMVLHAAKAYALSQLGDGKKNGGTKDHGKNRFEVLARACSVGVVSVNQACQWLAFRIAWDAKMAALHQENWSRVFSEMVQALLHDLTEQNKRDSLSVFMETEKTHVLGDVPMLCLPDAPCL